MSLQLAPGDGAPGNVAIVTGPNYSGKSVYLKTVGLLPYLAQVGCFVPAQQAVLGVVDRLFTRIHSLETASVNQSSFCIDLSQVGLMLRHATPRSLLLVDEFGKGTSSVGEARPTRARTNHCAPVAPSPARPACRTARLDCRRRVSSGGHHPRTAAAPESAGDRASGPQQSSASLGDGGGEHRGARASASSSHNVRKGALQCSGQAVERR